MLLESLGQKYQMLLVWAELDKVWIWVVQCNVPWKDILETGKSGICSDVLPLAATRRDSISNLASFGASNLS